MVIAHWPKAAKYADKKAPTAGATAGARESIAFHPMNLVNLQGSQ
jgi:hypothetical protein